MASASGRVDEMVKDYLIYRGLAATLRTLELELKNEKEKGFRVDKIVDQLQAYVSAYDISNLREYWNFLSTRLFSRLEQKYMISVRKLEVGLLKYYLVYASQSNKHDKIIEFFDRMTEILQSQPEFKDWFAFPFVRNPKDHSTYMMYYTQQWQDTFFLSLHNFLAVVLQAMPGPALISFEAEYRQLKQLKAENERLKQQIISLGHKPDADSKRDDDSLRNRSHMDMLFDFSALGEDTAIIEPEPKPRKFPFTSSPLGIGRKTEKQTSSSVKKNNDQARMSSVPTKDSKASPKGSKPVHIMPKQKKISKGTPSSQSGSLEVLANQQAELSTNQNAVEPILTNQKMKRLEEARQKRRELLDGGSDKTRSKEEKRSSSGSRQDAHTPYTRSMSESAAGRLSPKTTSRHSSKSISESKPTTSLSSVSETQSASIAMETVSPLATAAITTMLGTGLSGKSTEMRSMNTDAGSQSDKQEETDRKESEAVSIPPEPVVEEKPFIVLSQDNYSEHRSAVSYSRFSSSGQYIASVDVDGVVKVWTWSPKVDTAATVMSKSAFLTLEWASKSDRWLLLGNRSGNIRLFDVKEMKSFYEAAADASFPRIIGLCSNPMSASFVCSATSGRARTGSIGMDTGPSQNHKIGKLSIWDLKTMKTDRTLPLEPGPVCITSCSFNHNGQLLIAGAVDGCIRLFDVTKQKCVSTWTAHKHEVRQVLFSSDYTSCYSLGSDGSMSEWSMHRMGTKVRDLPIHQGVVPVLSPQELGTSSQKETPMGKLLALDSDGKYMLTCNSSGAQIYRALKQEPGLSPFMTLAGQRSSPMTTVDWSPSVDTKLCLTGYLDGTVTVCTLLSQ